MGYAVNKVIDHRNHIVYVNVDLEVDCSELDSFISVEEIISINRAITDPDNTDRHLGAGKESSRFEINRDEDYHYLRNPSIIETLVETKLSYECRKNSNLVWLTSKIMAHLAQNQAFSEGNKRTSYIVGVLFLIKIQLKYGDTADYPLLDIDLTNKLQELAVEEISCKQFYQYLKKELS